MEACTHFDAARVETFVESGFDSSGEIWRRIGDRIRVDYASEIKYAVADFEQRRIVGHCIAPFAAAAAAFVPYGCINFVAVEIFFPYEVPSFGVSIG